jgi:Uma2 family endonuclease
MATATSTAAPSAEQRVVLNNVDWRSYSRMLHILGDRPSVRLTYDRGTLEIMTLTFGHESWARFFFRLVVVLTEELGLPLQSGGSTTFRKRPKQRGLEPDECFWIANEALVRGKSRLKLGVDPPPDLAIEIEVTRSALNRMGIYAALGIPEVWRYDEQKVTFHERAADGKYLSVGHSRCFPRLTPADVEAALNARKQMDENAAARQFRSWVQQHVVSGGPSQP